jgi:hypothetical protein
VAQYLANEQVKRKNAQQDTFSTSQRVFTARQQGPVSTVPPAPATQIPIKSYDELREKFDELCVLYHNNKEEQKRENDALRRYILLPFVQVIICMDD